MAAEHWNRITIPIMIFDGHEDQHFSSLHNNPLVVDKENHSPCTSHPRLWRVGGNFWESNLPSFAVQGQIQGLKSGDVPIAYSVNPGRATLHKTARECYLVSIRPLVERLVIEGSIGGRDEKAVSLGNGIVIITSLFAEVVQGSGAPRFVLILILLHVELKHDLVGILSDLVGVVAVLDVADPCFKEALLLKVGGDQHFQELVKKQGALCLPDLIPCVLSFGRGLLTDDLLNLHLNVNVP
ncbi:hypothetical protein Cgig2_028172 [Carnegiea gigantea]|uniref:Uncharacterized protein n=1 Tax=Carnegiea gigantea TaxID=171969 RepID=A0A9Q1GY43_9CARY|nr:hypothetical protein Cgig2_028172 [Carnegiea gigantea]